MQHAPLKELAPGTIGKVTLKEELRTRGATRDHTKARRHRVQLSLLQNHMTHCGQHRLLAALYVSTTVVASPGWGGDGRRMARLCPPGANPGTLQTDELVPSPA